MTTTTAATPKQVSYIVALANKVTGRRDAYLSQVRGVIGISTSKASRGLTRAEASAIIEELLERAA